MTLIVNKWFTKTGVLVHVTAIVFGCALSSLALAGCQHSRECTDENLEENRQGIMGMPDLDIPVNNTRQNTTTVDLGFALVPMNIVTRDFDDAPPLNPDQLDLHRISIRDGLLFRQNGILLNTTGSDGTSDLARYVMSINGTFYVNPRESDARDPRRPNNTLARFKHSTFFGETPIAGAGHVSVIEGQLRLIDRFSGHYSPDKSRLQQVIRVLRLQGLSIDRSQVRLGPHGLDEQDFSCILPTPHL